MDGFYIKAAPLTPETALEIDRLLQSITISATSAEGFLSLRAALARIITGTDSVISNEKE